MQGSPVAREMRNIGRRAFLSFLGLPFAVHVARAQQRGRTARIGFLAAGNPAQNSALIASFQDELRRLGWVEGKNIAIEYRSAMGDYTRFPELLGELVRIKVDLIAVSSTPGAIAAKSATSDIPIVFASRIAVIYNPANPAKLVEIKVLQAQAERVGGHCVPCQCAAWTRSRKRSQQ